MNRSQILGLAKEAKGMAAEVARKLSDDRSTEYQGKAGKIVGELQARYGEFNSDAKRKSE